MPHGPDRALYTRNPATWYPSVALFMAPQTGSTTWTPKCLDCHREFEDPSKSCAGCSDSTQAKKDSSEERAEEDPIVQPRGTLHASARLTCLFCT